MLQLKNISKKYTIGEFTQTALDDVSLNFRENEFVAILGPSGSGKTTLLNIIGGLDRYDQGDIIINDVSTKKYKDRDWDSYRNNSVGFVFQSYNLIPHQSVLSNVELALTISGVSRKERKERAKQALKDELDIVIIDTAGRLQTKVNLMNELSKMKRVMDKFVPGAPHATYLVLDGNLGQNSLTQAREFEKATHVDGIILTKMDGTAKGGIIFTIIDEMNLKVNYIGLGEQMDDMRPFYRDQFFESMLQVEQDA